MKTDDYLLDELLSTGVLTKEQLELARDLAEKNDAGVVDTLVAPRGVLSAASVAQAKATYFGVEYVPLGEMRIADDVLATVRRDVAKRFNIVPVRKEAGGLVVAMADPSDFEMQDVLQRTLNTKIIPAVATAEDIQTAIGKYYGVEGDSVSKMIQDITEGEIKVSAVLDATDVDPNQLLRDMRILLRYMVAKLNALEGVLGRLLKR